MNFGAEELFAWFVSEFPQNLLFASLNGDKKSLLFEIVVHTGTNEWPMKIVGGQFNKQILQLVAVLGSTLTGSIPKSISSDTKSPSLIIVF